MPGAAIWGEWRVTVEWLRVSAGEDEKVVEVDCVDGCTAQSMYFMPRIACLKMVNW